MEQFKKSLDQYTVLQTLGSGGTSKVKLGFDQETGQHVALKILKENLNQSTMEQIEQEIQMMLKLNHENIIKLICFKTGVYKKKNSQRNVAYLVYERAQGGELMDFLLISGGFSEPFARYYFKQLMLGLDYCHTNGVTHRDLKPDNLLLDKNFNLKIADFGFAAPFLGRDGSGILNSRVGTVQYLAPEIILGKSYKGKDVDIFSAGVCLFAIVTRSFPFELNASLNDERYKLIATNQIDQFWQSINVNNISEELKDLLTSMLQLDPLQRPTINEILSHSWLQGVYPCSENIKDQLVQRQKKVRDQLEKDRQKRKIERMNRINDEQERNRQSNRGLNDQDNQLLKSMDPYDKAYEINTEFFSSYPPQIIEKAFIDYLTINQMEYKQNLNKYKLKFTDYIDQGNDKKEENKVEICMRILQVDEENVCVQFKMISGTKQNFIQLFTKYEEQELSFANDYIFDQIIQIQ